MPRLRLRKSKSQANPPQLTRRPRFSALFHSLAKFWLPIVLLFMIRFGLIELAVVLVLLSKWRTFAVRPRHWLANLRSNATDLIVKLSTLVFVIFSQQHAAAADNLLGIDWGAAVWTVWYIGWLTYIKPRSDDVWVGVQALAGLFLGLCALISFSDHLPEFVVVGGAWLTAIYTSRHFLTNYEEPLARTISYAWGLVVAELVWASYRWVLVYLFVPQIAIIIGLVAYTLGSLFDAQQKEKLTAKLIRQQAIATTLILIVVLVLSDWSGSI